MLIKNKPKTVLYQDILPFTMNEYFGKILFREICRTGVHRDGERKQS